MYLYVKFYYALHNIVHCNNDVSSIFAFSLIMTDSWKLGLEDFSGCYPGVFLVGVTARKARQADGRRNMNTPEGY